MILLFSKFDFIFCIINSGILDFVVLMMLNFLIGSFYTNKILLLFQDKDHSAM